MVSFNNPEAMREWLLNTLKPCINIDFEGFLGLLSRDEDWLRSNLCGSRTISMPKDVTNSGKEESRDFKVECREDTVLVSF
jgi:hypothetical protein